MSAMEDNVRRSAKYHPSIWGDYFSHYTFDETIIHAWVEQAEVKEKVRSMLTTDFTAKPLGEKLDIIDAIQRLGVSYHFEEELEEALEQINRYYADYPCDDVEGNLRTTSLLFRLLRQRGYNVSCDIFNKLKDRNGSFKEALTTDIEGMLSLYEATHLRVHGETILNEALTFVTAKFESMVCDLDPCKTKEVIHALTRPIRKGLTRLEARDFISRYQENKSHHELLVKFAKLDFNILQQQHRKELSIISQWWQGLEFGTKLPFARDRVAECYLWILGVYYEPQYAMARYFFTQVILMNSTIDDLYDNYGTKSELEMFTDAVERWDISAKDKLPQHMSILYQALLDVFNEMEKEMAKEGRSYAIHYGIKAVKRLTKAYFEETKWLDCDRTMPTMEEYTKVSLVSSGYALLATASFVGMGQIATKESFDWLFSEPKILKAACFIARIMSDMVTHEFEQQRDHIPSAVECYMNQYGVSEKQACVNFNKEIEDAWMDINQEFLQNQETPMNLLMCILNLARVIDFMYKEEDHYTNSITKTKQYVTSVLVNPVKM